MIFVFFGGGTDPKRRGLLLPASRQRPEPPFAAPAPSTCGTVRGAALRHYPSSLVVSGTTTTTASYNANGSTLVFAGVSTQAQHRAAHRAQKLLRTGHDLKHTRAQAARSAR